MTVRPSVCLSQTGIDTSLDKIETRGCHFSPYDILGSAVLWQNIMLCVRGVPLNEGEKKGHPLNIIVILLLLACLAQKLFLIGRDILLIVMSTGGKL